MGHPIVGRFVATLALLCTCLTLGCKPAASTSSERSNVVHVFAAASLADVMTELAIRHEANTGITIKTNFAASSTLAQQIKHGAPADVFVSANPMWMDHLEERHLIQHATRCDLVGNRLVLIAKADRKTHVEMKRGFAFAGSFAGRIALADPDHVPAGRYAQQALTSMGWWSGVENRVVPALDVRAALRFVERGEVDIGIVYATDAAAVDMVTIIAAFPDRTHDPIRYPVALGKDAAPEAGAFLRFLRSSEAAEVFGNAGFTMLGGR